MDNLVDHIHFSLSGQALDQLILLLDHLDNSANSTNTGIWVYIWGSPNFVSSKAYKHLCGTRAIHPCFSWFWKSNIQNKHKVFPGYCLRRHSVQEVYSEGKIWIFQVTIVCYAHKIQRKVSNTYSYSVLLLYSVGIFFSFILHFLMILSSLLNV